MNLERLQKVEEIYHAVLRVSFGERDKFLQESCGEDSELRSEVESLLSFEETSENILDSSPKALIEEVFADVFNSNLIGKKINQYEILSLLGEGGMGAVFLAEDTKLERKVAIKFLSDRFIRDRSSLERFFREARSASALNHPNIITVHEIGEFENKPFIAAEFIDGVTMRRFLAQEKPPVSEILDIAVQICSALSTAHRAGIIHRDIKPDNIMIRRDGIVKVLDFGIAKLSRDYAEIDTKTQTPAKFSTVHGLILGTPHYMSPEQARGKKVDARSDIWSFGVLFYQMLTRRLPFEGDTTPDIIASILKSEPLPLTQLALNISPDLEKSALKALRKKPNERYENIDQLSDELKSFRRRLDFEVRTVSFDIRNSERIENEKITNDELAPMTAGDSDFQPGGISLFIDQTIGTAKTHPVSFALILITAFSVLTTLALAFSKSYTSAEKSASFEKMKLAKLTFDGTTNDVTAISPDGKYIVYALRDEGKQSLMIRQIATSSVVQLVAPAANSYIGLQFSPDGNYVYYALLENDLGTLYKIPTLGGNSRKILDGIDGKAAFAPGGKTLAFVRNRTLLMTADEKGGSEKILATSAPGEFWRIVEWSPDGETILSSVFSSKTSRFFLSEISVTGGAEKRILNSEWETVSGLAWLKDGSGIILAGRDPDTKMAQIWKISYPDGKISRITNDFSTYIDLSLTADNNSLVTVKQDRLFNLWVSPNDTPETAKKITFEEGKDEGTSGVAWTTGGKIVYTVRKNISVDIWIIDADGSGNRQLTSDQGSNFSPAVSPDGRFIVFTSDRTGNQNIWRMEIDGGNQIALTETPEDEGNPGFTPDGKWIIYQRTNAQSLTTIWKIKTDGGSPVQLTNTETSRPIVSPDGKLFACDYEAAAGENSLKVAIFPIDGGQALNILDLPLVTSSRTFRWNSDGKSLIYVDFRSRAYNLWSQTLDENPPKQMTFFESGQIARFGFAPDGKTVVLSRGNETSDVITISDFK